jgi:hypothetical protein
VRRILLVPLALSLLGPAVTVCSSTDARAALHTGKYLYVVSNGALHVYRFGTWNEMETVSLPDLRDGVRGVAVNLANHSLYIAHGGYGGAQGNGSLMRWDLMTQRVTWDRAYPFGVDQPAVCGGRVYMPTGEGTASSAWRMLDAGDGREATHPP